MARVLQPHQMLAARFPAVAATWHPTANLPLTPETVAPKAGARAVWRCSAGHEWEEVISTRTAMPAWKKGDVAACRVCIGYHSIVSFDCGHTAEVKTEFSDPSRGCPGCRQAAYRRREEEYAVRAAAARATYAEDRARARDLLAEVDLSGVPAPLLGDWRTRAVSSLASAVSRERHHGEDGATDATLALLVAGTRELLPDEAELEVASRLRQPVKVLGRAHWPAGWRQYLHPSGIDQVRDEAAVAGLRLHLETAVAQAVSDGAAGLHPVKVITRWLTENVASWAYGQVAERPGRWNVFRELSLPVTTPGKSSRFGRLDVTVLRPDAPDLVVELDSTHNDGSVAKLEFARDAGAVAVWVRWHSGRLDAPAGVAVIDLLAATKGLAIPS